MDPLDILPAELWLMIFEEVEDGQDWLNLYRASPTFEGLVGGERRVALLSQVFPLVRKHLHKDLSKLLPLRLVSKNWKKAVDKSLESSEYDLGKRVLTRSDLNLIGWNYYFRDSGAISRFLDKFDTHPGNPFIGSCVMFCFRNLNRKEAMMEFRDSVQRLMDRFGNQISKLCITYSRENRPDFSIFLEEFRSCVALAPNLEELHVRTDGVVIMRLGCPSLLGSQSLPIISKLKSFFFYGVGEAEPLVAMQNTLIRLCCNPDSLKTARMVGVPTELTTFPNLETATVAISRIQTDVSSLMNSSWPLTRLTLRRWQDAPTFLDARIMECVKHFKETLISLRIGDGWVVQERNLDLSLALPKLKHLDMRQHLVSRQILGNLPSLERMGIFAHFAAADVDHVKRLLEVKETQFSEFKIWEMLPRLNKIEVIGLHPSSFVCKVYYIE